MCQEGAVGGRAPEASWLSWLGIPREELFSEIHVLLSVLVCFWLRLGMLIPICGSAAFCKNRAFSADLQELDGNKIISSVGQCSPQY